MPRGRPPKPHALRVLDGTHRKDRHGDVNPTVTSEPLKKLPVMPRSLGYEGKKRWKHDGQVLIEMGILERGDIAALEMYCCLFDEAKECEKALKRDGEYHMGQNGYRAHPAIARHGAAVDRIIRLQSVLGLTPSARSSMQLTTTKKASKVTRRKRG